jgi:hypothetical protein
VDKYSEEFVKSNKQVLSELYGDDEIREMREELQRAVEFGDEKVALAVQTYELVRILTSILYHICMRKLPNSCTEVAIRFFFLAFEPPCSNSR